MLNSETGAGVINKSRCNRGVGGIQKLRERKEHRPFCFRAFAANSSRETEKQKQKHQTWRRYDSGGDEGTSSGFGTCPGPMPALPLPG